MRLQPFRLVTLRYLLKPQHKIPSFCYCPFTVTKQASTSLGNTKREFYTTGQYEQENYTK